MRITSAEYSVKKCKIFELSPFFISSHVHLEYMACTQLYIISCFKVFLSLESPAVSLLTIPTYSARQALLYPRSDCREFGGRQRSLQECWGICQPDLKSC